jgi:hypothetical protein
VFAPPLRVHTRSTPTRARTHTRTQKNRAQVSVSGFTDSLEKLEVLYFLALAGANAVTSVQPQQTSHVVVKDSAACGSSKMLAVRDLQQRGVGIRIVESGWLSECLRTWSVAPEEPFLVAGLSLSEMARALRTAASQGDTAAMRVLLDHPCADPAEMMMNSSNSGSTALMFAASQGRVDAMRLLLDHPSADPATMVMHTNSNGDSALMLSTNKGRVDAMRLLLDHPSTDAAAMMVHASNDGATVLLCAASEGEVDVLRLLLDHPSADPAAMLSLFDSARGISALVCAANFAVSGSPLDGDYGGDELVLKRVLNKSMRSFAPLLFLLRRVAEDPQPSDVQEAHMTKVMEALCQVVYEGDEEEQEQTLFDDDQPDAARDESIRLLLEHGATPYVVRANSPIMLRIIREAFALARVPQLLNEAVLGVAIARQQDKPHGA